MLVSPGNQFELLEIHFGFVGTIFILTKTNRNCLFFSLSLSLSHLLFGLLVSADIARFRSLQPATNLDGGAAADVCGEQ